MSFLLPLLVSTALSEELIRNIYFAFSVHKNCVEAYEDSKRTSGVYTIDPDNTGAFDVLCDQTTASGGWTVIQKTRDGEASEI